METYEVLIVDDERPTRMVLRGALEGAELSLREAGDAETAWASMRESPPDLVVCDYSMPGMNGVQLIKRMREDPVLHDVSVMLLTGYNTLEVTLAGVEAGADDFLAKPFDTESMRIRVLALLRHRLRNRRRTALPSGAAIPKELERRLREGSPFAATYLTLESFEPYAYKFGFRWASTALLRISKLLDEAFVEQAGDAAFVGHAIGAHFVAITPPAAVEGAWASIHERLERLMPLLYDAKDLERRRVLAVDRFGMPEQSPLLRVSGVVVEGPRRGLESAADVARQARAALHADAEGTLVRA